MPTFAIGTLASSPASTLAVSYAKLRRAIGLHLSWDRNPDNWHSDEVADCESIIEAGLSQFYWPRLDGGSTHVWSFLTPVTTLALVNGTAAYDLPSDFTSMVGRGVTFSSGSDQGIIERVGEEELRALIGADDLTGVPKYCAVRPKDAAAGEETAYEILFYPTPNSASTVLYRYSIEPMMISDENPYPLGGTAHSNTIMESCLAAAERILEDNAEGEHFKAFQRALAASIELDKQAGTP